MKAKLRASNYHCNHTWRKIDFVYMQLQHREHLTDGEKNKSLQLRCKVQRETGKNRERPNYSRRVGWFVWTGGHGCYRSSSMPCSHTALSVVSAEWRDPGYSQQGGEALTMTCVVPKVWTLAVYSQTPSFLKRQQRFLTIYKLTVCGKHVHVVFRVWKHRCKMVHGTCIVKDTSIA